MKADLSLRNNNNENIFEFISGAAFDNEYEQDYLRGILAQHGVTSGDIPHGFRSTLCESALIAQPKRLVEENDNARFYLRAMTLPLQELKKEAREFNEMDIILS